MLYLIVFMPTRLIWISEKKSAVGCCERTSQHKDLHCVYSMYVCVCCCVTSGSDVMQSHFLSPTHTHAHCVTWYQMKHTCSLRHWLGVVTSPWTHSDLRFLFSFHCLLFLCYTISSSGSDPTLSSDSGWSLLCCSVIFFLFLWVIYIWRDESTCSDPG